MFELKRRAFITLFGSTAVMWPLAALAQQPGRTYRLGFFLPVARDAPAMVAFFDELRVHGFVEGRNLAIIPGGFQAGNQQIDDLVPAGFAASLAHPGGNITGISLMSPDLDGKRQDILIEAVPGARHHHPVFQADSRI